MEKKIYEVKFNSYGIVHVLASSYGIAVQMYEDWVKKEFPDAKDWETKSISEVPASKPVVY